MGTGFGILLIAVGAILAFAVHTTVNGIDIQTVGVILMVVGALGIILDLLLFMPRRRRVTREQYTTAVPGTAVPGGTVPGTTVTRGSVDDSY